MLIESLLIAGGVGSGSGLPPTNPGESPTDINGGVNLQLDVLPSHLQSVSLTETTRPVGARCEADKIIDLPPDPDRGAVEVTAGRYLRATQLGVWWPHSADPYNNREVVSVLSRGQSMDLLGHVAGSAFDYEEEECAAKDVVLNAAQYVADRGITDVVTPQQLVDAGLAEWRNGGNPDQAEVIAVERGSWTEGGKILQVRDGENVLHAVEVWFPNGEHTPVDVILGINPDGTRQAIRMKVKTGGNAWGYLIEDARGRQLGAGQIANEVAGSVAARIDPKNPNAPKPQVVSAEYLVNHGLAEWYEDTGLGEDGYRIYVPVLQVNR